MASPPHPQLPRSQYPLARVCRLMSLELHVVILHDAWSRPPRESVACGPWESLGAISVGSRSVAGAPWHMSRLAVGRRRTLAEGRMFSGGGGGAQGRAFAPVAHAQGLAPQGPRMQSSSSYLFCCARLGPSAPGTGLAGARAERAHARLDCRRWEWRGRVAHGEEGWVRRGRLPACPMGPPGRGRRTHIKVRKINCRRAAEGTRKLENTFRRLLENTVGHSAPQNSEERDPSPQAAFALAIRFQHSLH